MTDQEELEFLTLKRKRAMAMQTPEPMVEPASKLKSLALGGVQGGTFGFADEAEGAIRALGDETYKEGRDAARKRYEEAEAANPKTYMAGQLGGAILPVIAAEMGSAGTATPAVGARLASMLAPKTLQGVMALGAVQGLGESKNESAPAQVLDAAKGAGLYGAFHMGGKAVSPVIDPIANKLAALGELVSGKFKNVAMDTGKRAVGFTKRLLNTPLKERQANEAVSMALEKGIITPLSSTKAMQEAAESVSKESGQAMGKFLQDQSNTGLMFDPLKAIEDLNKLRPKGLNIGENQKINTLIDNALETVKSRAKQNHDPNSLASGIPSSKFIDWEGARELKSLLQKMANYDTTMSGAANEVKKKIAGSMRNSFMGQLEESSLKGGGEKGFDAFAKNVKDYGSAETLQDALQNRLSSESGNATIGLRDAALGGAELANTGNFGKAAMVAGGLKLGRKYGNQTISSGANAIARRIETNPAVYGKYANDFMTLAKRGGSALAAHHFILSQSDPEYRKLAEKLDKDENN
jgi:hypothetical protein